jgi:single-strand DNA-binding protein
VAAIGARTSKKGNDQVAYDLTGKVKLIQAVQTFGSGFTKREMVVIVQDGKYPQEINLEFVQDKVGLLENLQVGQDVTVTFDIRGREYNGRYFNNLQGWKIVTSGNETVFSPQGHTSTPPGTAPPDFDDSDIPF